MAKFADQEFFDQHRYGSIYYNGVEKGLEIFEMLEVDAYDFNIYDPGIQGEDRQQAYLDHLLSGLQTPSLKILSIQKNQNHFHTVSLMTRLLDVSSHQSHYGFGTLSCLYCSCS
ncbi:sortase [Streptococcus pneumoniae]|nr:sortase [Streptococcus pneumoniae]